MTANERMLEGFARAQPKDMADLCDREPKLAAEVFVVLEPELIASVLHHMNPAAAALLLGTLPAGQQTEVIESLSASMAAVILGRFGEERQNALLETLDSNLGRTLRARLAVAPNSAGSIMDLQPPAVHEDATVAEMLSGSPSPYDAVYVVGAGAQLRGTLPLSRLIGADPKLRVESLMLANPASISHEASLTSVVSHPAWQKVSALAVVNSDNCLVGTISYESYRRLERELGSARSRTNVQQTAAELAEFYAVGASALLRALIPTDHGSGGRQ